MGNHHYHVNRISVNSNSNLFFAIKYNPKNYMAKSNYVLPNKYLYTNSTTSQLQRLLSVIPKAQPKLLSGFNRSARNSVTKQTAEAS